MSGSRLPLCLLALASDVLPGRNQSSERDDDDGGDAAGGLLVPTRGGYVNSSPFVGRKSSR